ncbi:MAG TPA: sulfotransferase family 2 domain-containing protein [Cyclobacteriaceae bacterium]
MLRYFQLIWLIAKHGQLKSGTENVNYTRDKSLQNFQEFIPIGKKLTTPQPAYKTRLQNLIGQAAFLKNSFKTTGGHLTAHDLGYIRIPKSASTSMSKAMLERKYPTLQGKPITDSQINFLTDVNLTSKIDTSTLFMIVRNPFARIVSVYRDFFENENAPFIYNDYLFGVLPKKISFGEFVTRVSRIPDRLKDQHLRPQHTFLRFYRKRNVSVKILKLEEPGLFTFLSGNSLQLPHLNKSSEDYDYGSYYDLAILNKVHQLYAADIQEFGYQKEHHQLEKRLKTVH